jgi:hypothetical protein
MGYYGDGAAVNEFTHDKPSLVRKLLSELVTLNTSPIRMRKVDVPGVSLRFLSKGTGVQIIEENWSAKAKARFRELIRGIGAVYRIFSNTSNQKQ